MSILNKVSTKPNPLSFRWHSSISILAYLILNAIYVERIFSLLQWSKYLYRVFVKWSRGNSASIDEKSQRINVPSLLVEVYYLLVATLIVLIALSGWSASLWAYCFAIYLLIDTSVWVLYYFFFVSVSAITCHQYTESRVCCPAILSSICLGEGLGKPRLCIREVKRLFC